MILILLGTQNNSFHRLIEEIEKLIQKGIIKEKVIVQAGYTKVNCKEIETLELVSKEELEELQNKANIVITHGGVGSIMQCITKGKKVIAVSRLKKYKEHVNDHQKEIVEAFNEKGYIIGITEVEELEQALKKVEIFEPKQYIRNNKKILKIIEDFIE
ncbi:MAG: beta(1,3)galactosyltransferase EpsH [Clostridia bacterium]|nr:beta(1,3)galactosyltransferase EpsH [Clostridia bacterium]